MIFLMVSFMIMAQGHTVHMYNFIFKEPYLLWSDNIAKAPNLSRPHNNIGNLLWNWGFYEDAYKSYEKSFNLNRGDLLPMIAAPIHNMGRYYLKHKNYTEAMTHFQTAIKINPQHAATWVNLAQTQMHLLDLKGAENTTRQALRIWPDNVHLHSSLSLILLKQREYDRCTREAWKTLVLDSEATDAVRVLAEAHHRTGQYKRAVLYWDQYSARYRNDLEGHLALIDLYSKTGQTEKLDGTIAKVMILKGAKSWREMLNDYNNELASHAYEPDSQKLLSIIRNRLRNQQ